MYLVTLENKFIMFFACVQEIGHFPVAMPILIHVLTPLSIIVTSLKKNFLTSPFITYRWDLSVASLRKLNKIITSGTFRDVPFFKTKQHPILIMSVRSVVSRIFSWLHSVSQFSDSLAHLFLCIWCDNPATGNWHETMNSIYYMLVTEKEFTWPNRAVKHLHLAYRLTEVF